VRPEDDDYDLLTYAEASARLAELLSVERERLAALRSDPKPDPDRVAALQQRVELLERSTERYRRHANSGEAFTKRFGQPERRD
jgi:hypothetical protein